MSCGYKYEGIVFSTRQQLVDYFKTGKKPLSDISLQQMKNSVMKNLLNLSNPKVAISGIVKMFPDFSDNEKQIISENFGNAENMGNIYYNYKTKGVLNYENKNEILPLFNKVTEYLVDLNNTVSLYNQPGMKPIKVSEPISQFLNNIQNENTGVRETAGRQSGPNSQGLFKDEASKWFIPGRESEGQTTGGRETGAETSQARTPGTQGQNAGAITPAEQRSTNGTDSESIKRDTIRNAGSSSGHPARVRISTGDYVAWSGSTGQWTNIVKPNSNGRWGVVRPANAAEVELAEKQYQELFFNDEKIIRNIHEQIDEGQQEAPAPILVNPERFDIIENFITQMLFEDKTGERLSTLFDEMNLLAYNGKYFFKDQKTDVVNSFTGEYLKTFQLSGEISDFDRKAVLAIKRPLSEGTADMEYYRRLANQSGINTDLGFMDFISDAYDSFIDTSKNFLKVMEGDSVIYEEQIPHYVSSVYFTEMSNGGGPLFDAVNNMLRQEYEIEEEPEPAPDERFIADQKKINNIEDLRSVLFGSQNVLETLQQMVNSGFLEVRPSVLYTTFANEFMQRNISYDEVVSVMGIDMFPIIPDELMSASKIDEYDMLPNNVADPERLFRTMGFTDGYIETFSYLYSQIPEGYNRVKTALKIGLELFYPEIPGIGILNHFPYTKDEIYSIQERYGENAINKMHDIFQNELMSGENNFYIHSMIENIGKTLRYAKGKGFALPLQYERVFSMFRPKNPLFENGDIVSGPDGRVYDVYNVDYTDANNLQYYLRSAEDRGIYVFDSSKIGEFSPKVEYPNDEMKMAFENAEAALQELGTSFEVKSPFYFHNFFGERTAAAMYDPIENKVLVSSDSLTVFNLNEEVAHAAFIKGVRINKNDVIALHRQIYSVLTNGTDFEKRIAEIIDEEVATYNVQDGENAKMTFEELRAHEFLAKLVSILATYKKEITSQSQKSIIERIIKWFRDMLGFKRPLSMNNIDDVIAFINGIAQKIRTGETIRFEDYKSMFSDPKIYEGGVLLSKNTGIGVLSAGKRYAVTGPDKKIKMRTVFLIGEVNGVPFVQFEDSPTRYFTDHISVVPYKGYTDKYGIIINKEGKAYEQKNPVIIDKRIRDLIQSDFAQKKPDGSNMYSDYNIYKKYFEQGFLGDMTYPEFQIFSQTLNTEKEPQKPASVPIAPPKPSSPVMDPDAPNPTIPPTAVTGNTRPKTIRENMTGSAENETLEGILFRINNFDIDKDTIENWLNNNTAPEYYNNKTELGMFVSGESITKYTGESPKNNQTYLKFQLGVGSEIADSILADLKALFGEDYVQKTLDLLSSRANSMVGTVLMHAALERDLIGRKKEELSNHRNLNNMQKIVHSRSQAYIRNVSKALNARKTAYQAVHGSIKPSDIESIVLPKEYVKKKDQIINAVENGDLNEISEEVVISPPRTEKRPPKKKTSADKWVNKLKDNTYIQDQLNHLKDLINKIC